MMMMMMMMINWQMQTYCNCDNTAIQAKRQFSNEIIVLILSAVVSFPRPFLVMKYLGSRLGSTGKNLMLMMLMMMAM